METWKVGNTVVKCHLKFAEYNFFLAQSAKFVLNAFIVALSEKFDFNPTFDHQPIFLKAI